MLDLVMSVLSCFWVGIKNVGVYWIPHLRFPEYGG